MVYQRENWRNYQKRLKKAERLIKIKSYIFRTILFLPILTILLYASSVFFKASVAGKTTVPYASSEKVRQSKTYLTRNKLHELFNPVELTDFSKPQFSLISDDKQLLVKTSINNDLQEYLRGKISHISRLGRGKPKYLAIVAMEPESGKILAMAGYNQGNDNANPCLENIFPAASIFKIVTAAAAVEKCGLTPRSTMKFNGGKYTLYKKQLKERNNKYTNRITFKDSFAQSVNPVFGKIGSLYLGKQALEKYAAAFGFNRELSFEMPLPVSHISVTDEPYQWAEIASGFNRKTKISPIHGVLLSGAVINHGLLPEPTIIDTITDPEGNLLYTSAPAAEAVQAIKPETSTILKNLMASTISSGTGRKSFRGYRTDPVLGRLNIGGKTGSIFNQPRDVKFDWFVGYAEEKKGESKLAVSVVVGHEKYIGIKACRYARMTITHYFENYFALKEKKTVYAKNESRDQTVITR